MRNFSSLLIALCLASPGAWAEDIVYCRGGLVGVGDWGQSMLYPLKKNADGIFEGTVNMVARTECTSSPSLGYGNRVDLFFDLNNTDNNYCCAGPQQFITPANKGPHKLQTGTGCVFQSMGGEYKVFLDLDNMEVSFEAVEPAWIERVIVAGDLENSRWQRLDESYALTHRGDGIYTGDITVVESDNGDGLGYVVVMASYVGSWTEGRYCPAGTVQTYPGVEEKVGRYNGEHSVGLEPGDYTVTFDMNNGTLRFNDVSDPEYVQTRAHAELGHALDKAKEQWPEADLGAVQAIYDNPSCTDVEMDEARKSIPGIIRAYVLGRMESEGNAQSPADGTYLISNADYSANSRDGWSGSSVSFAKGVMYASNMDFNHYQAIDGLPNGVYRVSVNGVSRYGAMESFYAKAGKKGLEQHNVRLYATASGATASGRICDIYDEQYAPLGIEGESDPSGEGWYVATTPAAVRGYMDAERYGGGNVLAYVTDGKLTVGARLSGHVSGSWAVCDDWKLEYYGNSDESFMLLADLLNDRLESMSEAYAGATEKEECAKALKALKAAGAGDRTASYVLAMQKAEALDNSMTAYAAYNTKVQNAIAELDEKYADLSGAAAELYRDYLNENIAPGIYPNGSAAYILENGKLDAAQLDAEATYMEKLLSDALRSELAPGTDITSLLVNTDFFQPDFEGWEMEKDGNGSCSGSHGLNTFRLAGFYNMNSFRVSQTCDNLPNGLYAMTYNGFFRTGAAGIPVPDDLQAGHAFVGEMHTPMLNVIDDAISGDAAIEGENCHSTDYVGGDGLRYPDAAEGASVAFANGRYGQTVYGTVTDGTLTIGFEQNTFPEYPGAWSVFGGVKVVYLGTADDIAKDMLAAMQMRGENIVSSIYNFRETVRNELISALEMPEGDYTRDVAKCEALDRACDAALYSAGCYSRLEKNIISLYDKVLDAGTHVSESVRETYRNLYNTVYDNLTAGVYEDDEAARLAEEYRILAEKFTPIMAKGGLQNVGNWGDNDLYLLYPNDDGVYEGTVKFIDADDLSSANTWWGSRGDLFFKDANGEHWSCGKPSDRFITPSVTKEIPLTEGTATVFQAIGGDYHIWVDMTRKTVRFESEREFYMDSVYCVGTLTGQERYWNANDYTYSLNHVGSGVYKGVISVDAASEGGKGEFGILASYGSGDSEGRYGSMVNCDLAVGKVTEALRTNSNGSKWFVEPGEWHVTFDMNNFTVRLNTVDAPDYVAGEGENPDLVPMYCRGGLQGVGNWEKTDLYPLYKNKDGIYEGNVTFTDLNMVMGWNGNDAESRWGNRGDLFFEDAMGNFYSAAASISRDDKFLVHGKCGRKLPLALGNANTFQGHAGTYKVLLDIENMEVEFRSVEEKWMDEVYVFGTLKGHRWSNSVAEDRSNVLKHIGNGVYQGLIDLEEDNSTLGSFAVQTAYNAGDEGRYTPMTDKEKCPVGGIPMSLFRTGDSGKSIAAEAGRWFVSFDWSHGTIRLFDPDDETALKEIGMEPASRTMQVGIYTLDGRRIYSGYGQWNTATPGIYIQVTDDSVKKVMIK